MPGGGGGGVLPHKKDGGNSSEIFIGKVHKSKVRLSLIVQLFLCEFNLVQFAELNQTQSMDWIQFGLIGLIQEIQFNWVQLTMQDGN